jgi:7,8-dihydropterin-6-yl-methyl-4-(beta-D-ribofuranosyl)aminobenzene 5'-phosphate synthase
MVRITCVVDNTVRQGSLFWGEHGVSFRIETDQGCFLFDTGRSESVLWHNMGMLGGCPRDARALVLSHAHIDHSGALVTVLSQKPGLPLYGSPDLFRPRFTLQDGKYKPIGLPLGRQELRQLAELRLSQDPAEVLPGVWTSGEIPERSELEGRSARHFVPSDDDAPSEYTEPIWKPDPYGDDMSLVVETRDGLVVVCGCCHAGLLNTLAHVRRTFQRRITAILGGTHLVDADDVQLNRVIDVLRETYGGPRLHLNHCTGTRAYVALASAFGDQVSPCPVGTTLSFE